MNHASIIPALTPRPAIDWLFVLPLCIILRDLRSKVHPAGRLWVRRVSRSYYGAMSYNIGAIGVILNNGMRACDFPRQDLRARVPLSYTNPIVIISIAYSGAILYLYRVLVTVWGFYSLVVDPLSYQSRCRDGDHARTLTPLWPKNHISSIRPRNHE